MINREEPITYILLIISLIFHLFIQQINGKFNTYLNNLLKPILTTKFNIVTPISLRVSYVILILITNTITFIILFYNYNDDIVNTDIYNYNNKYTSNYNHNINQMLNESNIILNNLLSVIKTY